MLYALNVKTSYSILSSLIKIDELTKKAKELGYFSLAIADLNNMFGAYEFYLSCRKNDIKPLIGIEINNTENNFILLAKNNNGYKNLIKLTTIISDGDIDKNILMKYKQDLILILSFDNRYNSDIISIYDEYFIGYSTLAEQDNLKKESINNYIYNNDARYIDKEDYKFLDYLIMIREDKKLGEFELNTFKNRHLLDKEEFNSIVDKTACENMKYIVDVCNVTLEYTPGLLPIYDKNINTSEFLRNLSYKGIKKRLNNNLNDKYIERLEYELSVIEKMGFCDYFLVVWDYVKYAKFNNILVGPGRGSAAGSLVSYAIGITDVDPIKYNLLFERFLNPERVTMPDIDVDFDSEKRGLVTEYVTQKYGEKNAIGIITFNTFGAKQVIRDLARCMGISLPIVDDICKSITSRDLKSAYTSESKFFRLINSKRELKVLYEIGRHLEGLPRHVSIHAAGIVMSNIPIDEVIPLYKNPIGIYTTAYSKDYLEPLGLLKMDFLGIDNLTLLSNVINEIREKENINITFERIPDNDKKAISIFTNADTDGIFQFESVGMKRFLEKFKIKSFNDIVLALALYRPGPMENIDTFLNRRENKEKIDYIHPDLRPILEDTYGIIVYQEQIMQIVRVMAGYSFGEADILRRAMSKKKEDVIVNERPKFINGCLNNGYNSDIANEVYDLIVKFANYGFNKSHSVAYAITSYRMAFIKAYFPKYFLSAILSNSIGNDVKTNTYINKARREGIKILPPDVNFSKNLYFADNNGIRCPLSIIKSVGAASSYDIIKERENGLFVDFYDFVLRMNSKINKRIISNLINAGAINLGYNRRTLVENLDNILNYTDIAKDSGMITIEKPLIVEYEEYSKIEITSLELKTIGFYLTEHPVSKYRNDEAINCLNIDKYFNRVINIVLLIKNIKETSTKNNDIMAFITGEDEFDSVSLILFPDKYKKFNDLNVGNVVLINGRVEKRFDKYQIIVNNVNILE